MVIRCGDQDLLKAHIKGTLIRIKAAIQKALSAKREAHTQIY